MIQEIPKKNACQNAAERFYFFLMKYNLDHYNLYMKVDLLIEPKVPATRME
jgi:hypothetical protein